MLEADIQRLNERASDHDLGGLEADVWAGIEAHNRMARTTRVIVAWQTVVVALMVFSSVVTGNLIASPTVDGAAEFGVFSPDSGLAPSTLLLGHQA
jgi:hypothetical protein